jgi:hypothetical protein
MLQELLSVELGLKLGWYQHVANSIHIYKSFYKMARAIVSETLPKDAKVMSSMNAVEWLPKFLTAEEMLRKGDLRGPASVGKLPQYWQNLAKILLAKAHPKVT